MASASSVDRDLPHPGGPEIITAWCFGLAQIDLMSFRMAWT
jgi:hypothetical protein